MEQTLKITRKTIEDLQEKHGSSFLRGQIFHLVATEFKPTFESILEKDFKDNIVEFTVKTYYDEKEELYDVNTGEKKEEQIDFGSINVGDVVGLKSGSCPMVVIKIKNTAILEVAYFNSKTELIEFLTIPIKCVGVVTKSSVVKYWEKW